MLKVLNTTQRWNAHYFLLCQRIKVFHIDHLQCATNLPLFLTGAGLSGEVIAVVRRDRALALGICAVQERFARLCLPFPQLAR